MKRFIFSCFWGTLLLGGCCTGQSSSDTKTAGQLPIAAIAPAAAPSPVQPKIYVVQSGDTLALIARKCGVTIGDLMRANASSDPTRLKVGQILQIPDNAQPPNPPQSRNQNL